MGQFHHPNVLQLYGVVVHFDEVSTQLNKSVPQLQAWYFASSDQQKLCTWGTWMHAICKQMVLTWVAHYQVYINLTISLLHM